MFVLGMDSGSRNRVWISINFQLIINSKWLFSFFSYSYFIYEGKRERERERLVEDYNELMIQKIQKRRDS